MNSDRTCQIITLNIVVINNILSVFLLYSNHAINKFIISPVKRWTRTKKRYKKENLFILVVLNARRKGHRMIRWFSTFFGCGPTLHEKKLAAQL